MAFFENCFERVAGLAGGAVWMWSNPSVEPAVMAAVASAGLAAVIREAVARRGPEDPARLARIQREVRADFQNFCSKENLAETDLAAAADELDRSLAKCFLDRQDLAATTVSAEGFPSAATALILHKLALENPMFAAGADINRIAREFATVVIRKALKAAVEDADYFRKLEPHLLLSIGHGVGRVEADLGEVKADVKMLVAQHRDRPAAATFVPAPFPLPALCLERDDAVAWLVARMLEDRRRPVAVMGLAGIGKTTAILAGANAAPVEHAFGCRRYFVRGDLCATADALLRETASAIGMDPSTATEGTVCRALGGDRSLLVFDNFDTVWHADGQAAERIAAAISNVPGVTLVLSVRGDEPPGQPGWLADEDVLRPLALGPAESRRLFLHLAPAHAADAALDPLLAQMDGLPLAISLLAALAAREQTLHLLSRRWEAQKSRMLTRSRRPERTTSLSVALDLAWDLLDDEEGRVLARWLAHLPAGIAIEDLETLLPGGGAERALCGVGLAYRQDERLRTLVPIRAYLAELGGPLQSHEPDDRLIKHFLEIAASGEQVGQWGAYDVVQRLEAEWPNCESVIDAGLGAGFGIEAVGAALGYGSFVSLTGLGTGIPLESAFRWAQDQDDVLAAANCAAQGGQLWLARSDVERGCALMHEAGALFRKAGSIEGEAKCACILGEAALNESDLSLAMELVEHALQLFRRLGDQFGEATCLLTMGQIASRRSDYSLAEQRLDLAERVLGECFVKSSENVGLALADCSFERGVIAMNQHQAETAHKLFRGTLPMYSMAGHVLGQANCHFALGRIAAERSDQSMARAHLVDAQQLFAQINDQMWVERCAERLRLLDESDSPPGAARPN